MGPQAHSAKGLPNFLIGTLEGSFPVICIAGEEVQGLVFLNNVDGGWIPMARMDMLGGDEKGWL